MRCPKCGNESEIIEEYVCSYCGHQMKVESIEKIPIFRRVTDKWFKPERATKRILMILTKPNKAFFDIYHKKEDKGPMLVKLLNALFTGLIGMVLHWKNPITLYYGYTLTLQTQYVAFLQGFAVFLTFFLFGLVYYSLLFWLYDVLFSVGANISVRLDDILRIRYNVQDKGNSITDILSGKMLREEMAYQKQTQVTNESIKRQGEMLTKIKQTGKDRIMHYAYAPTIVVNMIAFVLLLVSLPSTEVANTSSYSSQENMAALLSAIWDSPIWQIIEIMNVAVVSVWIPINLSIGLRELANTNTTKLLIGSVIVGMLLAYMVYFLRPTLGWNFDIIAGYTA